MTNNLLETLKEHLSGDVVSNIATLIGETPKLTESALNAALPSLIAALSEKSTDSVSIGGLFNLLTGGGHDGGVLSNLGALSRGGDESTKLISDGGNLLLSIFGNKVSGLTDLVASSSGISNDAASRLLNFITPIILGLLGRNIKINNLGNAGGLAEFLTGQNNFIHHLLPAGYGSLLAAEHVEIAVKKTESETLADTVTETAKNVLEKFDQATESLGKSEIAESASHIAESITETAGQISGKFEKTTDEIGDKIEEIAEDSISSAKEIAGNFGDSVAEIGSQVVTEGQQFAKSAADAFEEGAGESRKLLPWILIAAALALIWGLLKSCGSTTEPETTTETVAPKTEITPPAAATAAPAVVAPAATPAKEPETTATEPQPVDKAAETSSKLFEKMLPTNYALKTPRGGFIDKWVSFIESPDPINKDLWFSMDGITFDTNKATIRKESETQLNDIAEILKAYPKIEIKIGGYTDNTGNAKANKKLSANRANAVKKALVGKGIESARLEAEGYGSDHPVASNDTESGRQQNRRIDVRVTQK